MIKKILLVFLTLTLNQVWANKIIQAIEKNDLTLVQNLLDGYNFSKEERENLENAAKKNLEKKIHAVESYFKMTSQDALKIIAGTCAGITFAMFSDNITTKCNHFLPFINIFFEKNPNVDIVYENAPYTFNVREYPAELANLASGASILLSLPCFYLAYSGLRKDNTKYQYIKALGIMGLIKNLK